ncbi:MAG: hypothetical protein ACLUFN_00740 [Eubacterium sp.]
MKEKFIRVLSPFTLGFVIVLDAAVIGFAYYAVQKLSYQVSTINVIFAFIDVIAIIVAVLVTKEVLTNGVKFRDDEVEFTGIDDNNLFDYDDIIKIDYSKDNKASLKKNFIDRYSSIIIYLKDESVVTIELGLTTNGTLKKIVNELNLRIEKIND